MKILLTGADGFIGSHLAEKLIKNGYETKAFVMYNSFNSWGWLDTIDKKVRDKIDIFSGDIRDSQCLREAIKGCDTVIHLAALIAIPFSYISPRSYVDTNVHGTLNILEVSKEMNISKIIHTSTSEVYGSALHIPIDEEHPIRGQSPYSASKIAADQLAISYHSSFESPITILRPFNTYGPRQSARAIIPTIIMQILNGNREINLGDTSTTRDFNYIDDTTSGFISALKSDKAVGEVINIGSGFEISINDLVKLISDIMDVKIKINIDHKRIRPENSEVLRLCAKNVKAKKLLNWSPKYGNLDGLKFGISQTIDWMKSKKNIRRYKNDIYNI
tara:strand:+ start:859 stop:1854 length:996 start_codon:yes stop_codon:yes gene_type:complete